jgi:nicotinamide mononucleotide (NMN) deamidase PncC
MALSVKQIMKTDYAIATTGNAGPSKEIQMPNGTVLSLCNAKWLLLKNLILGNHVRK